jgi:hypothetical protein
MANTRNQSMLNTVRSSLGQLTGNRGRGSRGRTSRGRNARDRDGLASQASGFISGFLSGGGSRDTRGRSRSRGRRER